MCNAKCLGIIIASAALLAGCAGADPDKAGAEALLVRADSLLKAGEPAGALAAIEELDSLYPKQTAVRREAMKLTPLVREQMTSREISQLDSLIAENQLATDSLGKQLKKVANPIEPYFVVAGAPEGAGLSARLSPEGTLYMLSRISAAGGKGHTSVSVTAPGGESARSATVARDGERNDIVDGMETVTYVGAEIDTLARFVEAHAGVPLQLTFHSAKGDRTLKLPEGQMRAVAIATRYAGLLTQAKLLHLRREAAERSLAVARSQQARLN